LKGRRSVTRGSFTIRPLETVEEYKAAEEVQRLAWGLSDLDIAPLHILLTIHKSGGLALGAFDAQSDTLLGFLLGFYGRTEAGHWKHCSHMMGVLPEARDRGIGHALKLEQRRLILADGLDLITWTFDPLEARNATLNFSKLGVVSNHYIRNIYGDTLGELNAGLPTDRLSVDWWIGQPRVQARLDTTQTTVAQPTASDLLARATPILHVTRRDDGLVVPQEPSLDCHDALLALEIPSDFQALKAADTALAMAWRMTTRALFEQYFAAGYSAIECLFDQSSGQRRNVYILETGSKLPT
jgi:predicted GNAT superfamily acetyltransferase